MRALNVAPKVSWPAELATQAIGVLGMRGAGKSNLARVFAEELWAAGIPFVVFDPIGNWYGIRAGADQGSTGGIPVPIFGGEHGDLPLDRTSGAKIADLILERKLSCVLDLSHADFSETDKRRFLVDFGDRLFRRKTRESGWLTLIMEEADDYAPQTARGPILPECLGMFQRIVKRGRFKGLGALMVTQRSAALNKDLLYMVGTLVVFRSTGPRDQEAVAGWVRYNSMGDELLESLPELKAGEAWVIAPEALGKVERVTFRRMHTFDTGSTPDHGSRQRQPTLADIDVPALSAELAQAVEKAKAEDPRELRRTVAALRSELAKKLVATTPVPFPVLKDSQHVALERLVEKMLAAVVEARKIGLLAEAVTTAANEIRDALRSAGFTGGPGLSARAGGSSPLPSTARPVNRPWHEPPTFPKASQNGNLTGPEQRILDALGWLNTVNHTHEHEQSAVAFLAGYTVGGGAFNNPRGALRSKGLIEYRGGDRLALTEAGRGLARAPAGILTAEQLQAAALDRLPGPEGKILRALLDAYPKGLDNDTLARASGYEPGGGAYNNPRGRLRSLGLIEYRSGLVYARPTLFLEGS